SNPKWSGRVAIGFCIPNKLVFRVLSFPRNQGNETTKEGLGGCAMAIDEAKLNEFLGRAVGDIGAGMSAALVLLGDKLGLYKALAKSGPLTPAELAQRTGTAERYVREWLNNQAAGGYVNYDAGAAK